MKIASCFLLVCVAFIVVAFPAIAVEKPWKAAKLKTARTSFGKLTARGDIKVDGKFNDTSKVYDVIEEQEEFVKLSDGTQSGWVLKVSLTQVEAPIETAPSEPDIVKSGNPSDSRDPMLGKKVFFKDEAIAMVASTIIDKYKYVTWPAQVEEVIGEWLWLSRAWVRKEDVMELDEALDYFTEKVHGDPKDSRAWSNRGACWRFKGELQNAVKDADESIRLDPTISAYFHRRGFVKFELKDYSGAVADYDEAIRLDPKDTLAYINRGNAKVELRDYPGAVADYDAYIRLDPKESRAFINRGNAKSELMDYPGALADYDEAILRNPKDALAYISRGNAKRKFKDYTGACADFDEAIRLDPKSAIAFDSRAYAKFEIKDYSGAIADFDVAIRREPENPNSYNSRGWNHVLAGNFKNAVNDFDRCIELAPGFVYAMNNKVFLLSSCSDTSILNPVHALELAKVAEKIEPKSGYTLNALSCAYAASGDFGKAIECQEKALQNEQWVKDEGLNGGGLAPERIAKWRAKEQWTFSIAK